VFLLLDDDDDDDENYTCLHTICFIQKRCVRMGRDQRKRGKKEKKGRDCTMTKNCLFFSFLATTNEE